jgi:hypothetical protein
MSLQQTALVSPEIYKLHGHISLIKSLIEYKSSTSLIPLNLILSQFNALYIFANNFPKLMPSNKSVPNSVILMENSTAKGKALFPCIRKHNTETEMYHCLSEKQNSFAQT